VGNMYEFIAYDLVPNTCSWKILVSMIKLETSFLNLLQYPLVHQPSYLRGTQVIWLIHDSLQRVMFDNGDCPGVVHLIEL